METCIFCGHTNVVTVEDGFYECMDCSVLYAFPPVKKSNCEHVVGGVPVALREPWYDYPKSTITYIVDGETQRCSVCGAMCVASN